MCAYFSKTENESSEAMKQTTKEASKFNLNAKDKGNQFQEHILLKGNALSRKQFIM